MSSSVVERASRGLTPFQAGIGDGPKGGYVGIADARGNKPGAAAMDFRLFLFGAHVHLLRRPSQAWPRPSAA